MLILAVIQVNQRATKKPAICKMKDNCILLTLKLTLSIKKIFSTDLLR